MYQSSETNLSISFQVILALNVSFSLKIFICQLDVSAYMLLGLAGIYTKGMGY